MENEMMESQIYVCLKAEPCYKWLGWEWGEVYLFGGRDDGKERGRGEREEKVYRTNSMIGRGIIGHADDSAPVILIPLAVAGTRIRTESKHVKERRGNHRADTIPALTTGHTGLI